MLRIVLFFRDIDSWNETENLKQRKQTHLRPALAAKQIKPQTLGISFCTTNYHIQSIELDEPDEGEQLCTKSFVC
jgi:hypothetical protein